MPLSAAQNGLRLQLEQTFAFIQKMGTPTDVIGRGPSPDEIKKRKAKLMAVAIHTYAIQALVISQGGGVISGVAITPAGPYPVLGTCLVSTTGVCT